jgi:hypothetical protein
MADLPDEGASPTNERAVAMLAVIVLAGPILIFTGLLLWLAAGGPTG